MRRVGYNAVSYRDIAAEMGIKSASLHYHFSSKEELGVALVRRYSQSFRSCIDKQAEGEGRAEKMIEAFVEVYRQALGNEKLVCLCAVLGAEAPGLPVSVAREVKAFFNENIDWLTTQYELCGDISPNSQAKITLALLEGAMIISSANDDDQVFEAAAESIIVHLNSLPSGNKS